MVAPALLLAVSLRAAPPVKAVVECVAEVDVPARGPSPKASLRVPFKPLDRRRDEDEVHVRDYAAYVVRISEDILGVSIFDQNNGSAAIAHRAQVPTGAALEFVAQSQTGGRSLAVLCRRLPPG